MAKILLDDMVRPKRKRSEAKPVKREVVDIVERKEHEEEQVERKEYQHPHPRFGVWLVALMSVLFFVFSLSFLFSSVKVTVNPKKESITLNENFIASREPQPRGLSYDLVVISGEEKVNIPATGERQVAERATGTVVIFNSFSSAPQKLDIDTRLTGSNGKLYKTKEGTTVPGMKPGGTPGTVEVEIYAVEAGGEYNSGPLDFQILGFKGTPKYEKFQVRTKTGSDIKGGFIGGVPVVSEEERVKAGEALEASLKAKLLERAAGQIPEGFVLYNDAVFLNADEPRISAVNGGDKEAELVLKGTLYGIILNEGILTKRIAEGAVLKYDGSDVYIPNIRELKFIMRSPPNMPLDAARSMEFSLSGRAEVVWKIDEEKFTRSILGLPKKNFIGKLREHENIDSANLRIIPPWRRTIPLEAEDIDVVINYPDPS